MNYIKKIVNKYNNLNIVVKASLWFTICSIIQKGISIITMPIFTRLMTTEEYGKYSVYISWLNLFIVFMTLNIHKEVFNKGLIDNADKKDEFTANQIGLIIILTAVFSVIYLLFYKMINKLTGLSIFLTITLIIEVFSTTIVGLWSSRKKFDYDYKKIILITMISAIMDPVIGILLVFLSKYKMEARALSIIIVPLIFSIIFIYKYSKKTKLISNVSSYKNTLKKSVSLLPHYLSLVLLNQSDKLMINHFEGASKAAIYNVAHTVGLLMVLLNEALNSAFVPWAYEQLKLKKYKELPKVVNALLYIVMIANILLILIAPECITIIATNKYKEAIWCVAPIAISVYSTFIYTLFVDIEIYYNGNIFVTISSIIATIVNIILNYIFIPKFGYTAAAYTTLISYIIITIMHYLFMKYILKKSKIKQNILNIKEVFKIFIILLILASIALFLYKYIYIRYTFVFVLILITYLNRKNIMKIMKNIKVSEGDKE